MKPAKKLIRSHGGFFRVIEQLVAVELRLEALYELNTHDDIILGLSEPRRLVNAEIGRSEHAKSK